MAIHAKRLVPRVSINITVCRDDGYSAGGLYVWGAAAAAFPKVFIVFI